VAASTVDGAAVQAAWLAAVEQVAIGWAERDLAGALAWLLTLPPGELRETAVQAVAYEAARTEARTAVALAAALPATAERDDLLVHAVSQWAISDGAAAVAWARQVPERKLAQRLVGAVAVASADRDGPGAAALAAGDLDPGEDQDRVAVAVAQRWAANAPEAAAAWVARFSERLVRNDAVHDLLDVWARRDADAAHRWAGQLPAGPLREAGLAWLAEASAVGRTVVERQNPAVSGK
jgi:hypothetical protein